MAKLYEKHWRLVSRFPWPVDVILFNAYYKKSQELSMNRWREILPAIVGDIFYFSSDDAASKYSKQDYVSFLESRKKLIELAIPREEIDAILSDDGIYLKKKAN